MQSNFANAMPNAIDADRTEAATEIASEPTWFQVHFVGCMEMYADASVVADYFDAHQDWFPRCAKPMSADRIGENGYALTIGRFGSFGYEVEPKVGLHLLPQHEGLYLIETIPVPDYTPPGYDVDFKAAQQLIEAMPDYSDYKLDGVDALPDRMTQVEWNLDLKVAVFFPKFIQALPQSLIQKTGDRLLAQIVKQVSRRLTYKVQEDFHQSQGEATFELFKKIWSKNRRREVCHECTRVDESNGAIAPEAIESVNEA
ncbi:DUF1997 domain-containing protein [Oxynema sp. CENA135]|uniref:DUF1997 domain-containing protein n=1 Tax=Oxynema sp. CENA135 TaxID=984206 RepID=UPI001F396745|nr:DUF1997 domain-containing protein [Oxynema sp. CENA135]